MSFEKYYLTSLFEESDDNSSCVDVCSALRNSLVRLHTESLNSLSNTSTNMLLKQRLFEYSQVMNDKSDECAVNSFAEPIDALLRGKIQTRHCSLWKNKLGVNLNYMKVFKKSLDKSDHCNVAKNIPCASGKLEDNDIKMLLENKHQKIIPKALPTSNFLSIQGLSAAEIKPSMPGTTSFITPKPTSNSKSNDDFLFKKYNKKENIQIDESDNFSNYVPPKMSFMNHNSNQTVQNCSNKNVTQTFWKENTNKNNVVPQQRHEIYVPNQQIQENPNKQQVDVFRTARTELNIQNKKKYGNSKQSYNQVPEPNLSHKKSLGTTRSVQSKFIPPMSASNNDHNSQEEEGSIEDERLKHIDAKMVELIRSEIIDSSAPIGWDDIAGLDFAKTAIQEAVVWPLLRPDIFTGLRRPPKGILLFGPPGTGKTLIGKCIASQCCATFFSISASSLTSKWIGDGEKMVRALFAVARCHQPAVVFIDEIDSLLTQRSDTEHEATRRIKTEFLVQLDGAATGDEDRLLVIGATNRPQELDEAARRRLVKRLYIPLPDIKAREQIVNRLMSTERHSLVADDVTRVALLADGFSGADMRSLCSEAALGPIRAVPLSQITNIQSDEVRPVSIEDFIKALGRVRPSVSGNDLEHYTKWDQTYGSGSNSL